MESKRPFVLVFFLILSCWLPPTYIAQRRSLTLADMVFVNGQVYTVDAARSWATAIAIRNGKIVFVGSDMAAKQFIGTRTRVINLQGKFVLPGFHDSHVHPIESSLELSQCNLNEKTSKSQILDEIRQYVTTHPKEPWIRGGGWQLFVFANANPHKSLLDAICADRPVYLVAADGHSAWVNSRALQIAGITKSTPDPPNGRIERDSTTGEPTGTLRENAADLVAKFLPKYSEKDYLEGLRRGLKLANQFGITSIQDASAKETHLKAYAELDRRGELTVRVRAAMYVDPEKGLQQLDKLKEWRTRFQGKNLSANSVKIFADGVIEPHTAALLEPYIGLGEERGKPNWEAKALTEMVQALDREGFQIHVHAIGDRAIRMALDAFENARKVNGSRDSRHHIAHLELINPADIPRFRSLNVIANFQPLWAYADPYITKLTEPVLGPQRSRWLYPIASVVNSGALVVCGSDWSVSSLNPLEAMQIAVTRRGLDEGKGKAWIEEELVELPVIIAGYTINGAYVNFQNRFVGSLEAGKSADITILDRNLFAVQKTDIHKAKVLLTMMNGKVVYRDAEVLTLP